ncbi:MAG: T9SS type A sorting domain-containing protein [Bacteroidota bacterium]
MKKITLIICLFLTTFIYPQEVGDLDASFGDNGKVITSINPGADVAYAVGLQDDQKIVVAGYSFSSTFGDDFACLRLNTDGSLDNTFGNGGIVTLDVQLGSDDRVKSLDIQLDGKIVLAGYSDDGSDRNAAIVRLNTDGSLDTGFGNQGIVLTDFENNQQDEVNAVKIRDLNGDIIVGGTSVINTNLSKPVVARYDSDGNLDTSFNSTGIRLLWITNTDDQYRFSLEDLDVKPNGKITAVGWRDFVQFAHDADYWACKINANGDMDSTFSPDGVRVYNGSFNGEDKAFSVLIKPNDNLLISGAGAISELATDFTIFETTSVGDVISSPVTSVEFDTTIIPHDTAYGMKEDVNGRYIVVGSSGTPSTERTIALARLNSDLSVDSNFGTSGKVTTTFNSNDLNEAFDLSIQTDNKIVVVGYTGTDMVVARYITEENLSVSDETLNTSLELYPNPFNETLKLVFENTNSLDNQITIYNSKGIEVFSKTLNSNVVTLDLGFLASGLYLYQMKSNNGAFQQSGKLIKR